jgi:hypothetical protein
MALAWAVDHDALGLADSASLEPQLLDKPQRVGEFIPDSIDVVAISSLQSHGKTLGR